MAPDPQPDPHPAVSAEAATPPSPSVNLPADNLTSDNGPLNRQRRESSNAAGGTGPLASLRDLVDRLLVADVFVVLAGALWFGLAVLLHSRGVEAPLRLFQKLWQPLFTPAIGLLMAAALVSGALGWWQRRGLARVRGTGS